MHASSFYDLWAHYVYTPLYGPYSLSEALEGLLFYSLNESRDSIAIGSKRTLWHELIFELSNVVDDLQEYPLYFSSKFLISPLRGHSSHVLPSHAESSNTTFGLTSFTQPLAIQQPFKDSDNTHLLFHPIWHWMNHRHPQSLSSHQHKWTALLALPVPC